MANLVTWLVVAYFAVLGNNLLRTFFPATCSESDDPQTCIHPLLPKDGRVDLYAFAAPDPRDREYWRPDRRSDAELILAVTNLRCAHAPPAPAARRRSLRCLSKAPSVLPTPTLRHSFTTGLLGTADYDIFGAADTTTPS